jgi:hypothetical protein
MRHYLTSFIIEKARKYKVFDIDIRQNRHINGFSDEITVSPGEWDVYVKTETLEGETFSSLSITSRNKQSLSWVRFNYFPTMVSNVAIFSTQPKRRFQYMEKIDGFAMRGAQWDEGVYNIEVVLNEDHNSLFSVCVELGYNKKNNIDAIRIIPSILIN